MKKVIIWILGISLFLFGVYCSNITIAQIFSPELYTVTGTIYGKNDRPDVYKHHVDTKYLFAVSPDNKTKFKNFSVSVDFATFSTFNVGDRITFHDLTPREVLKNYQSDFMDGIIIIFGIFFLVLVVVFILWLLLYWLIH